MGYEETTFRIIGRVSRHNAPQDDEDNARWNELEAELAAVCTRPRYRHLVTDLQGAGVPTEPIWGRDGTVEGKGEVECIQP